MWKVLYKNIFRGCLQSIIIFFLLLRWWKNITIVKPVDSIVLKFKILCIHCTTCWFRIQIYIYIHRIYGKDYFIRIIKKYEIICLNDLLMIRKFLFVLIYYAYLKKNCPNVRNFLSYMPHWGEKIRKLCFEKFSRKVENTI